MNWKNLDHYFKNISSQFVVELLENCEYPWTPLSRLVEFIENRFKNKSEHGSLEGDRRLLTDSKGEFVEGSYFIKRSHILKEDFVDPEVNIMIGAGTFVEAGATVKNHTIIENNCEVRQGAYIRGNAYIGERSVVGHATEIKNSIFIRHVEAGHFAYVGDSIVGSYVNLGAGTKISNLEFRSLEAKKNDRFPEIGFRIDNENIQTGISKFGAIIGDGCETGCNSVLCPLVILEPECWIMPCFCVYKGIYQKRSPLKPEIVKKNTPG